MWIRRLDLDRLRADLQTAREVIVEQRTRDALLIEQAVTTRTQTAFLVARINQLEKERAIMVRHITKLEIPVPELAAVAAAPLNQDAIVAAMAGSMFEDLGDDEAKRQGIAWRRDGSVEYVGEAPTPNGHRD